MAHSTEPNFLRGRNPDGGPTQSWDWMKQVVQFVQGHTGREYRSLQMGQARWLTKASSSCSPPSGAQHLLHPCFLKSPSSYFSSSSTPGQGWINDVRAVPHKRTASCFLHLSLPCSWNQESPAHPVLRPAALRRQGPPPHRPPTLGLLGNCPLPATAHFYIGSLFGHCTRQAKK